MSLYEERKRLEQEDGEPLHTLRVMPDGEVAVRCHGAGVLVVAGEWGVTQDVEDKIVRPLAEMGYFVVAIDLIRGGKTADAAEAAARREAIDPEIAINDIASALLYLKELAGGSLGVFGLDAASGIAIEAATRLPQIDCVVTTGGAGPRKGVRLARTRSSIMVLRGEATSPMSGEVCVEMSKRIEPAMQRFLIHNFRCADGFFTRPADDDERDCAAEAFDHASSFLAQNLI
jgi:dienelactone hydrolase